MSGSAGIPTDRGAFLVALPSGAGDRASKNAARRRRSAVHGLVGVEGGVHEVYVIALARQLIDEVTANLAIIQVIQDFQLRV
jgi:hypothetical protein